MPYSIVNQSGQSTYNIVEYVVNTEDDIADVPTDAASGSTILVIETGQVYVLSVMSDGTKKWELLADEGGGGGGGSSTSKVLQSFIDNSTVEMLYDEDTGANYYFIRIYKNKIDGTKQYPFVFCPDEGEAATMSTYELQQRYNFCFAINAGIFNVTTLKPDGIVIQKGEPVYNRPTSTWPECRPLVIDANGDLSWAPYNSDAESMTIGGNVTSAVCGFMEIIRNYEKTDPALWNNVSQYSENCQRQIIGQFGNGDYGILTCEGRNYSHSDGWTIAEAQDMCVKYGFRFAYALDGGGSTETMYSKRPVNIIYERGVGRIVPTFIVFNGKDTIADDSNFDYIILAGDLNIHYPNETEGTIRIWTPMDLTDDCEITVTGDNILAETPYIEFDSANKPYLHIKTDGVTEGQVSISLTKNNKTTKVPAIVTTTQIPQTEIRLGYGITMKNSDTIIFDGRNDRANMCTRIVSDCKPIEYAGGTVTEYYPMLIPEGSTSMNLNSTKYYEGVAIYTFNSSTNKFTRVADLGWKVGEVTYDLTSYPSDVPLYYTVNIKNLAGTTISDASDIDIVINFEYIDKSDIVLLTEGGIKMDDATQSHIYLNPGAMRAAWVSNKDCGQEKILDLTGEDRYPIQIPSVINNIYLDFGEYYFGFALYNYDIDTNKYTRIYDAGWKGTPLTVDLTQYKAVNNILYYTVSIRKYDYTNLTESDYIALYNTSVIRYS